MTMHLERLRDDVRSTLGLYLTESTIDDQAIDAALRQALTATVPYLPLVTKVITLTSDGPTQDISVQIPNIAKVMAVRWPYDPAAPTSTATPYIQINHGIIQFKRGAPATGDQVLVIGRPAYTLAGVNGSADTLPEQLDAAIAAFAAAELLRRENTRRLLQPASEPSSKNNPLPTLLASIEENAIANLYGLEPVKANPAWGPQLL